MIGSLQVGLGSLDFYQIGRVVKKESNAAH